MGSFESINRIAVLVSAKKSLIDWVRSVDPDSPLETEDHDTKTLYLLPADDDGESWKRFLKKHYLEIFEQELESWMTDRSVWPQDRSWELFHAWLSVEMHSVIYDMVDDAIEKE